jgi:uncharacterized protein (DUF433 family)
MDLRHVTSKLPLSIDPTGVARVGETRVTLDVVIGAFQNGATCEEIVFQFPVLDVSDVYVLIGFYLKNQDLVEGYLARQRAEAAQVRKKITARFPAIGIRERLLNRRASIEPIAS